MKKLIFCLCALVLLAQPALAQGVSQAQYCNGAAIYDTAVLGTTKLVSAPIVGGIYVCGFSMTSTATATVLAKLTFSTAGILNSSGIGGNPLVTGALQVPITPAFTVPTGTMGVDHPAYFNGLFVPNGNQLNVTTSNATGPIQMLVYFWTQNP